MPAHDDDTAGTPEHNLRVPYVMRRPIKTGEQMHEEGQAWGDFHAGLGPKPVMEKP